MQSLAHSKSLVGCSDCDHDFSLSSLACRKGFPSIRLSGFSESALWSGLTMETLQALFSLLEFMNGLGLPPCISICSVLAVGSHLYKHWCSSCVPIYLYDYLKRRSGVSDKGILIFFPVFASPFMDGWGLCCIPHLFRGSWMVVGVLIIS